MELTAAQCRAARGLLSWTQTELGTKARIASKTIGQFEAGGAPTHWRTLEALKKALEDFWGFFYRSG